MKESKMSPPLPPAARLQHHVDHLAYRTADAQNDKRKSPAVPATWPAAKKPGSGNSFGPVTSDKKPISSSSSAGVQTNDATPVPEGVATALGRQRSAEHEYQFADGKVTQARSEHRANLSQLETARDAASDKLQQAKRALEAAVHKTICPAHGKCDFASALQKAEDLDKAVRDNKLPISESEDVRQAALRRAINTVLVEVAHESLMRAKDLKDPTKPNDPNIDDLIQQVKSWIITEQDEPAISRYGRLKGVYDELQFYVTHHKEDKSTRRADELSHYLVDKCKYDVGFMDEVHRGDIGLPPETPVR